MERLETKFTSSNIDTETGTFSGYGAVFGNIDSHGDIIMPGAFRDSLAEWKAKGRLPRMLLLHGSNGNPFTGDDLPIGKWTTMREDSRGLYVEGRLLALNTDHGRRILSLMRGGALDGLSIGFRVKRSTPGRGTTKRWLDAVQLLEVSIVDEPSNDAARVTTVKETPARSQLDASYARLQAALRALPAEPRIGAKDGSEAAAALAASVSAYAAELRQRRM